MSRIRTVKPELFKHEDLFDAEQNSQLPLRLAFIGLFTVADCEGRFKWRPRTIKLEVLPHDFIDFSEILNALEKAGFIQRYEVNGETYGWIPSFKKHQRFQTKELDAGSSLPPPTSPGLCGDATGTLPERYRDTQERKGKGKEGERSRGASAPTRTPDRPSPTVPEAPPSVTAPHPTTTAEFEALWNEYPQRNGSNPKNKALSAWHARHKEGHTHAQPAGSWSAHPNQRPHPQRSA